MTARRFAEDGIPRQFERSLVTVLGPDPAFLGDQEDSLNAFDDDSDLQQFLTAHGLSRRDGSVFQVVLFAVTENLLADASSYNPFHTGLSPLTIHDDVDQRVTRHALIDHQQVDVAGRSLRKHADRLQVDVDRVPLVLGRDLLQQIPAHGDPADFGSGPDLQGLGDQQAHTGFPTAGRGLDHHRAGRRFCLSGSVAIRAVEHVEDFVDNPSLVGTWIDLRVSGEQVDR